MTILSSERFNGKPVEYRVQKPRKQNGDVFYTNPIIGSHSQDTSGNIYDIRGPVENVALVNITESGGTKKEKSRRIINRNINKGIAHIDHDN